MATLWGVAVAGLGEALGGNLEPLSGEGSDRSLANLTRHTATGAASLFASAATRSALEGSSFGPNIRAGLPDVIGQALGRAIGGAARQALTAPAEQATATPGVRMTIGEQLSGAIVNLSSAGYIGDAGLDALLAPVLPLDELLAMREASGTLTSQEVAAIRAMRDDMAAGIVRAQDMAVFGQGQGGRFQSAAFDTHYSGAVSSNSISTFELRLRKANFDAFVGSLGDNPSSKQLIDISNYRLALQADENNLNAALAIADRTIIDMIGAVWGGVDVAKGTYRIAVNGEHTLDNYISAGSGVFGAAVGGSVKVGKGLISPLLKSGRVAERGVVRGPTGDIYSVAFEARLSPSSYPNVSRGRHFQEANESLLKAMEGDAVFAQGMEGLGVNLNRTPRGLAPRTSPGDWVWHHAQEPGVMQLVPRSQQAPGSIFQNVLHPSGRGGYSIWGKK